MAKKTTPKAQQSRQKLLDYLSDPENPWPQTRREYGDLFGKARQNIYRLVGDGAELDAIEREAYEIRKQRLAKQSAIVDDALYQEAIKGNVKAIKLWKQIREGWSERTVQEHQGGLTVEIVKFSESNEDQTS